MKTRTRRKTDKKKPKAKTLIEVVHGFRIREQRPGTFILQIRRQGISHTETFRSIEAARLKCEQLHNEKTQNGLNAFTLPAKERQAANEALQILSGRASLVEAAAFWLSHHPDGSAVTMQELANDYIGDLERRKMRDHTIGDARRRINRFCLDHGENPAAAITSGDITTWLTVRGGAPRNANNYRKQIKAVFNFAIKRGIIQVNPVDRIDPSPVDDAVPVHWSADRVSAILSAASSFNTDMVPILAVMAFAGLRPFEAERLDWENVNLIERIIRVLPETSKIRSARLVDIEDNLAEWLAPYRRKQGRLSPAHVTVTRWRARISSAAILGLDEVRKRRAKHKGKKGTEIKKLRLGWDAIIEDAKTKSHPGTLWPMDILRHTYATNWLAAHSDIGKLSELMGNSPKVIKASYKGLCTAKEAKSYWAITPAKDAKLIKFMA